MSLGLADIVAQVGKATGLIDTDSAKIEGNLSDAAALSMDSSSVLQQAAKDTALVESTKQAADLSTQNAKQKIGIDFGTDANAQNQVYTTLSNIEKQQWDIKEAAKAEIDRKENISLLDDPIGYITSKFTINQDIRKYNSAIDERASVLSRIADLNAATSSSAQLQSQFANTVTVASGEAAARNAAVKSAVAANEAKVQGLLYNNEGLKTAMAASAQELGFQFQVKQAQNADAQLALAQHHSALMDEEWAFKKEQKLKDDKYDSSIIDSINLGRAIRGLPGLSGVRADNALQMLKGKGPGAEEFADDWKAGEAAQATGTIQLANTPAAMIGRIKSGQAIETSPVQKDVLARLNDAFTYVVGDKTHPYDPKDVVGNTKKFNDAAIKLLDQDASEVKGSGNIFSPVPVNQIVKTSDAAAQTPVYQKVLKPLMDSGVSMEDPNNVIAATVNALRAKRITYEEATSLPTIYEASTAAKLANLDLQKFGIPDLPQYNRYRTRLYDVGANPGFGTIVDLTNPNEYRHFLNKQLSMMSAANIFGGTSELPLK